MGRRSREKIKIKVTRHHRVYRTVKVTKEILQCEKPYVMFGEAVKDRRSEIGLTQQSLADALGYSRASIANIEVGRQRVYLDDVIEFARRLKMKPRDLFTRACPVT